MRLIGLFIALLFMAACTSPPKYMIDPPPHVKAKIKIATQWVAQVGEKNQRQQSQLPVKVVGNKIYLANAQGYVGAMEITSGKVLWQVDLDERIAAGPGYGNGIIVIANNKAEVVALDESSGEQLWRQKVSSEVLAEPIVYQDKVFVQSIDGKLAALAKDTGKKLWVDGREIPALTLRGSCKPIIIKDKLLVGYATGELVAYDLESGKVIWDEAIAIPSGRTDLERIADIDGLIAANGDTVYVASYQGRIAAVSVNEGRLVWSRDMSSYTGVAADDKQVYVTDEQGFIWALDINSGATLWRQETLADRYLVTPAIVDHSVVVADVGGFVYWLSKEDGDILAQVDLYRTDLAAFYHWQEENLDEKDYGVSTYISVAQNQVLVRNNEGMLALFSIIQ
jgi:outer membrane protein assembly factor BamB